MSEPRFERDDAVVTTSGRKGVVWSVNGPLVQVIWDSDDEFIYSYRADAEWLQRLAPAHPTNERQSDDE